MLLLKILKQMLKTNESKEYCETSKRILINTFEKAGMYNIWNK